MVRVREGVCLCARSRAHFLALLRGAVGEELEQHPRKALARWEKKNLGLKKPQCSAALLGKSWSSCVEARIVGGKRLRIVVLGFRV